MPALLHLHTLVTPEIPLTGSPEWHRHQIPVRSRTGRILNTAEILAGAFTSRWCQAFLSGLRWSLSVPLPVCTAG